tara:strand:+ start:614 stop:1621 length:1008 start_codon:yes stop_codon:yes gene_type:complete
VKGFILRDIRQSALNIELVILKGLGYGFSRSLIRFFAPKNLAMRYLLLLCVFGCLVPVRLQAVIITGVGGDTGNTTAPSSPNDFPFDNVGNMNGKAGTGLYMGSGWVLTANHVGAGDVVFGGVTYSEDTGTTPVRINDTTDILLFKILNPPELFSLDISAARPSGGDEVFMMGFGRGREADIVYWDASWNELPSSVGATYSGYEWVPGGFVGRWGNNEITGNTNTTVLGTEQMQIDFDSSGETWEAMGSTGDSGGAVFYKNGSDWELAGMMSSISTISGQPSNTSVFGNATFAADLSVYRDDILTVIPEPVSFAQWLGLCCGVFILWRSFYQRGK